MTDAREALAALIENLVARVEFNASEHGEDAWWRGHVQGMKDAVFEVERLAAGWTPPGERVKPSVEDVARVLNAPVGFRWSDNPEGYRAHQARAVLALIPGRTEAEERGE